MPERDQVELLGYFEERTFKDRKNDNQTIRQFVVKNFEIRKMKVRQSD